MLQCGSYANVIQIIVWYIQSCESAPPTQGHWVFFERSCCDGATSGSSLNHNLSAALWCRRLLPRKRKRSDSCWFQLVSHLLMGFQLCTCCAAHFWLEINLRIRCFLLLYRNWSEVLCAFWNACLWHLLCDKRPLLSPPWHRNIIIYNKFNNYHYARGNVTHEKICISADLNLQVFLLCVHYICVHF